MIEVANHDKDDNINNLTLNTVTTEINMGMMRMMRMIEFSATFTPARKFNPLSVASAFAINVLEQPGGP